MIVSTSDTHLAEHTYVSLPKMRGDAYRSFIQIVDHAVAKKASGLILAGDVFDAQPESLDVECFLSQLGRLRRAGVKVYAIQGQHGRSHALPWTSIDSYVLDLHKKVYELEPGFRAYGLDNLPPDALKSALAQVPEEANVLVLHQLCKGAVPECNGSQTWDLDPEWIPGHIRLVLLGDYHDVWEYQIPARATKLVYHGSTCMQAVNEPQDKFFLEITVDHGAPLFGHTAPPFPFDLKRVPLSTRPFFRGLAAQETDLAGLLARLQELEPETFVYIQYSHLLTDAEEKIRAAAPGCHILCKPLPQHGASGPLVANVGANISLESCFLSSVADQNQPEFNAFFVDLLRSPDRPRYLQDAFDKLVGA